VKRDAVAQRCVVSRGPQVRPASSVVVEKVASGSRAKGPTGAKKEQLQQQADGGMGNPLGLQMLTKFDPRLRNIDDFVKKINATYPFLS